MKSCHGRIRARLLVSVLGTAAIGFAAPVGAETLTDAVKAAIEHYPSVEEASANRRAQDFELKQQRGLYLPSLDVSSGAGPEWTKNTTVRDGKTMPRYENQASLSLLLFDGFGRESGIERSASRVDAAASRVLERSQSVAASAIESYLNVQRNRELIRIGEDNVSSHNELAGRVDQRYRGGQSGIGDLQQARGRQAAARENLLQAQKDLRDSRTAYLDVVNREPDELSAARPPLDALPATVDDAIDIALKTSPTIAAASADLDEANAYHRQTKSNYWPKVSLVGTTDYNRNIDGVRGNDRDASVLLRMTYNLYRGGIDENRSLETAERSAQARAAVMRLERSVVKEVRDSWTAMENAKARAEVLADQVRINQEVVANYRQGFNIGQRDLLDLLNSENELYTSRARSISADYTYDYSVYRTLAAIGILTTTLGVAVPEESAAQAREGAGVKSERTAPYFNRDQGQQEKSN